VIKEAIAGIGENIQIRRFERFVLGEGITVAKADLAADVEAQTKAMQAGAGALGWFACWRRLGCRRHGRAVASLLLCQPMRLSYASLLPLPSQLAFLPC